ncbi:segregation/condensation protein A [Heliorestis acidaminivorans]|uniref:Segregation and condensation protein A n=1 Tax=Heliorestis acidaminivorans TaxID=553427 RepID=A0A6I0ETX4_9FIRM|nr:segregation/condensation protein A [Heliorestis acidaminivorans]KAB2952620.1 segregation/condensation protein A [Heliorestis acidaminivorans]
MTYRVSLPVFEGPFDLLFHLIEKKEVDIYDIPISQITADYLAYLRQMEELDLDVASSFLVMAATLLSIKARMLLPKPMLLQEGEGEIDEDPRQELVDRLLEYRKFKAVAEYLKEREESSGQLFPRALDPATIAPFLEEEDSLQGIMIGDLLEALRRVISPASPSEKVAKISKEEISIQERMEEFLEIVEKQRPDKPLLFSTFIRESRSISEAIVTFLALLELLRMRKIKVIQQEALGEIYVLNGQAL